MVGLYKRHNDIRWLVTFFMNQTSKAASYSWNSTGWRKLPLKQPEKSTKRRPRKRRKQVKVRSF